MDFDGGFLSIPQKFMEGFSSILYKFGDGIYIIPHELTEGFLFEISLHLIPVFSYINLWFLYIFLYFLCLFVTTFQVDLI